ncbi:MAG: MarR family transcriptional regulator [Candidatus Omnitrophica bacterium]|nr:MarR family transcriptional regulator [Candidatus Omnitrophota bacterium]MBU4589932.1 MarR family transcriptional regulator [Candidatus Omnitrophota bacterium]
MATIDELTHEISIMIPKLMKGARSSFLAKANISTAQMIMLVSIHDHGQCKLKTLARERDISPPTATGLIDRLVRAGYVKRGSDPEDRRVVMVSLTQKGEKSVQDFLRTVRNRWKNILVHLTSKEQHQYLSIVKKVVAILSGKEG